MSNANHHQADEGLAHPLHPYDWQYGSLQLTCPLKQPPRFGNSEHSGSISYNAEDDDAHDYQDYKNADDEPHPLRHRIDLSFVHSRVQLRAWNV